MEKYTFEKGFIFGVKDDATLEEIAETLRSDVLGHLDVEEKREFIEGIETFYKTRTSDAATVCVVKMSRELRREYPWYSSPKKPLCAALAEYKEELRNESLRKEAVTVRELLAYYLMPREAWVERKEALRRLEAARMLESAGDAARVMVGDILYKGYLAARYRAAHRVGMYPPESLISARAEVIAERKSNAHGLGCATRAECAAYLQRYVFDGSSCVEDQANGLLWAEQHGVADRVYGARIAEAFRTALASLGYSSAALEDIKRMQCYPVREVDELGKRMLAQLEA